MSSGLIEGSVRVESSLVSRGLQLVLSKIIRPC